MPVGGPADWGPVPLSLASDLVYRPFPKGIQPDMTQMHDRNPFDAFNAGYHCMGDFCTLPTQPGRRGSWSTLVH